MARWVTVVVDMGGLQLDVVGIKCNVLLVYYTIIILRLKGTRVGCCCYKV